MEVLLAKSPEGYIVEIPMVEGPPIWKLGCTSEFGQCECAAKRGVREKQESNLRGHGTRQKYQKGCSCPACRRANTRYSREHRRGTA